MNMGLLGAIANTVKTVKAVKGAVDQVKWAIQNAQWWQAQWWTTWVTWTTTWGSTWWTFLPWIWGNNTTTQQKSNVVLPWINTTAQQKLNETKQYFQSISNKNNAIQNTKSNVVLPWINTKPATTIKTPEEWLIPYEDYIKQKYKSEYGTMAKKWLLQWWNTVKKFFQWVVMDDQIRRAEMNKKIAVIVNGWLMLIDFLGEMI